MMKKASKSLVVAWLSVFLASCSEEPSEKDISNALDQVLRTEKDQLTGLTMGLIGGPISNPFVDMLDVKISNLEKIGCQQNGKNAYLCNVRYTVTGSLHGSEGLSVATPLSLMRASEGWLIATR